MRVAGCSCGREGGGDNASPFMVGHEEETSLPHHHLLAEGGNKACQFPHRFVPVGKSCIDLVQHVLLLCQCHHDFAQLLCHSPHLLLGSVALHVKHHTTNAAQVGGGGDTS